MRVQIGKNVVFFHHKNKDIFDSENGPLWKCIFLPNASINNNGAENLLKYNCALIFVQDHAINDGVGTVQMMKDFLFILNQLLAGKKNGNKSISSCFTTGILSEQKISHVDIQEDF